MISPLTIQFDDADVHDLRQRLQKSRWPKHDFPPVQGRSFGPSVHRLQRLSEKWQRFSVPDLAMKLNGLPNYTAEIDGVSLHFIHKPSERAGARPLILCHGWPGGVFELLNAADLLTNPPEGQQAFHVVIPSLPGFGFSSSYDRPWTMEDAAATYDELMRLLGYTTFAAQGTDWGSITARCLGALYPSRCKAVHLNFCPAQGPALTRLVSPEAMLAWAPTWLIGGGVRTKLERSVSYLRNEMAYYQMQRTKPSMLGMALDDSPMGLLAYIADKLSENWERRLLKYHGVEATTAADETNAAEDFLLSIVTYMWLTRSAATSFAPYTYNPLFTEMLDDPRLRLPNFGLSVFPHEIATTPRSWVARTGSLNWYKTAEKGGHFPFVEVPELMAEHVRDAIGSMWP